MFQDVNKEINEADSYIGPLSLSIPREAVSYVVVVQNQPSVQRHDGTKRTFKLNVTRTSREAFSISVLLSSARVEN